MLSSAVLTRFIEFGKSLGVEPRQRPSPPAPLAKMGWVNTAHRTELEPIADSLALADLQALIKALVILEAHFNWIGGSVAASITLFRVYERRNPVGALDLANWILKNRGRNDYLPFGSSTHARNLEEWNLEKALKQKQRQDREAQQKEQRVQSLLRVKKRAADHSSRVQKGRERGARRDAAIKSILSLPLVRRLESLARDWPFPLESFPTSEVPVAREILTQLDTESRLQLVGRIGRRRGFWGRLRRDLERIS